MSFDLHDGYRLTLNGGRFGVFWLLAGVAALALLLILHRDERRLISTRASLGLLAMRLGAALALVLILFEPTVARTSPDSVPRRLVVAVDVSGSMETVDDGRELRRRRGLRSPDGWSIGWPGDTR